MGSMRNLIAVVLQREGGLTAKALTRCTTRASPRRTSRSPLHFVRRCMTVVPKHTRHEMSGGADTGDRTPGLDRGMVALYH